MKNAYIEILRRNMIESDETELILSIFKLAVADAKLFLRSRVGTKKSWKFNSRSSQTANTKSAYEWIVKKDAAFIFWCNVSGLDDEFVHGLLKKELNR